MTIKIGNAAGFLGDRIDAAYNLLSAADVDVLTLEYLAELTLSILSRAKQSNPQLGYAKDFVEVATSIIPFLRDRSQLQVITNAGGVNVAACAKAIGETIADTIPNLKVAAVTGDDILPQIEELQKQGHTFNNLDTGEPLHTLSKPIVSANVYMGAAGIIEALNEEARIVITGRVADASLTVAPAWHSYDWSADQLDQLAAATVAGHLIECGAQVTGGYSARPEQWRQATHDIGYPIAEIASDGSSVITKPEGTGGRVDRLSVAEQLVYEIGDPENYLTPDVIASFATTNLEELTNDRVAVNQTKGKPAPDTWKVSLAYEAGYRASAQLLVYGPDCREKANHCVQLIRRRLGFDHENESDSRQPRRQPEPFQVELLGSGVGVPALPSGIDPPEVVMRLTVFDEDRDLVKRFTREIAPLITAGPAGLAGYAAGRIPIQTVLAYWPTLIPKECVSPSVVTRTAKQWRELQP